MTAKFRNKYRIESTRLPHWDYGSNAAYFVTICTKNRIHYFGKIVVETQNLASPPKDIREDIETQCIASRQKISKETTDIASRPENSNPKYKVELSEIGKIADQNWLAIPTYFPFVTLGNHVIMPNHMHGIIIIDKTLDPTFAVQTQNIASSRETQGIASSRETQGIAFSPETQGIASLSGRQSKNKFGPQSNNLASIIRGYKSSVKKHATMNGIDFVWQPLFHDHIIRSAKSFQRISEYIANNPMQWKKDVFHK